MDQLKNRVPTSGGDPILQLIASGDPILQLIQMCENSDPILHMGGQTTIKIHFILVIFEIFLH